MDTYKSAEVLVKATSNTPLLGSNLLETKSQRLKPEDAEAYERFMMSAHYDNGIPVYTELLFSTDEPEVP